MSVVSRHGEHKLEAQSANLMGDEDYSRCPETVACLTWLQTMLLIELETGKFSVLF